jgi:hypothetical protein
MHPRLVSVTSVVALTVLAVGSALLRTHVQSNGPVHHSALHEAAPGNVKAMASRTPTTSRVAAAAAPPGGTSGYAAPTFHEGGVHKHLVTAYNSLRWSPRKVARYIEVTVQLEVRSRLVPGATWHVRAAATSRSTRPVHSLAATVGARCRTILDYRTIGKYRWRTTRTEPWRSSRFFLTDVRSGPVNFSRCRDTATSTTP